MKETTQSERWRRASALFAAAARVERSRQDQVLEDLCPDDADLRAEVRELLQAHARKGVCRRTGRTTRRASSNRRGSADARAGWTVTTSSRRLARAAWVSFTRRTIRSWTVPLPSSCSDLTARLNDDERRRRLLIEARAAAALDHPSIATVYEIGETEDGDVFLAMAFYDGETLESRLARGPLPIAETLRIAREIARGLGAAHARGITHRDLKPSNVMLTRAGAVKLLDFGIARIVRNRRNDRRGSTRNARLHVTRTVARRKRRLAHRRMGVWGCSCARCSRVSVAPAPNCRGPTIPSLHRQMAVRHSGRPSSSRAAGPQRADR